MSRTSIVPVVLSRGSALSREYDHTTMGLQANPSLQVVRWEALSSKLQLADDHLKSAESPVPRIHVLQTGPFQSLFFS